MSAASSGPPKPHRIVARPRSRALLRRELGMRGRGGMDDEATRIADLGQMRDSLTPATSFSPASSPPFSPKVRPRRRPRQRRARPARDSGCSRPAWFAQLNLGVLLEPARGGKRISRNGAPCARAASPPVDDGTRSSARWPAQIAQRRRAPPSARRNRRRSPPSPCRGTTGSAGTASDNWPLLIQSKVPQSTRMPPSELPCPPMNFVSECSTMSAPCSFGRNR